MSVVTQYTVLKILLLLIFIISGYGISRGSRQHYWYYSLPAIVSYTIIQGLRYARGVDYLSYKFSYEHFDRESRGTVFKLINQFLNDVIGLPYYGAFMFYGFLLILAVILIFRRYRKIALFALPIFLITTILQSENLIRQFLAVAFIYLSFYELMGDRWKTSLVYFILGYLIHASCLILLPFFVLFHYVKIPKFSPWWLIGAYLLIVIFWKISYWGNATTYLNALNLDGQFSSYTQDAERWFTAEGSLSARQERNSTISMIAIVRESLMNCIIIYFGYKLIRSYPKLQLPFFLYYLSVILLQMAFDIEAIVRIGRWFYIFEMFIAGFVLTYTPRKNNYIRYALIFICINYTYDFISHFLTDLQPYQCGFIWNQ
ncbi:MAG: EpsG family protein [Paludibacteraceae bacterium]